MSVRSAVPRVGALHWGIALATAMAFHAVLLVGGDAPSLGAGPGAARGTGGEGVRLRLSLGSGAGAPAAADFPADRGEAGGAEPGEAPPLLTPLAPDPAVLREASPELPTAQRAVTEATEEGAQRAAATTTRASAAALLAKSATPATSAPEPASAEARESLAVAETEGAARSPGDGSAGAPDASPGSEASGEGDPAASAGGGESGSGGGQGSEACLAYEDELVRRILAAPYPRRLLRRGIEGTVAVRVAVGRDGALLGAERVGSSGSAGLDRDAGERVRGAAPFPANPEACGPFELDIVYDFESAR